MRRLGALSECIHRRLIARDLLAQSEFESLEVGTYGLLISSLSVPSKTEAMSVVYIEPETADEHWKAKIIRKSKENPFVPICTSRRVVLAVCSR